MGELIIRHETEDDYFECEEIIRLAFWNLYRPGCYEHYQLHELRDDPSYLEGLSFIAEKNGYIEGGIYCEKATIATEVNADDVLTFYPFGVDPSFQKEGVGTLLVEKVIEEAKAQGYKAIVVIGLPDYFPRFGFKAASLYGITMPDKSVNPALQILELEKGFLPDFRGGYFLMPNLFNEGPDLYDLHEYDKAFPFMEKKDLPE
jgi:putative acetyltransferase